MDKTNRIIKNAFAFTALKVLGGVLALNFILTPYVPFTPEQHRDIDHMLQNSWYQKCIKHQADEARQDAFDATLMLSDPNKYINRAIGLYEIARNLCPCESNFGQSCRDLYTGEINFTKNAFRK